MDYAVHAISGNSNWRKRTHKKWKIARDSSEPIFDSLCQQIALARMHTAAH